MPSVRTHAYVVSNTISFPLSKFRWYAITGLSEIMQCACFHTLLLQYLWFMIESSMHQLLFKMLWYKRFDTSIISQFIMINPKLIYDASLKMKWDMHSLLMYWKKMRQSNINLWCFLFVLTNHKKMLESGLAKNRNPLLIDHILWQL